MFKEDGYDLMKTLDVDLIFEENCVSIVHIKSTVLKFTTCNLQIASEKNLMELFNNTLHIIHFTVYFKIKVLSLIIRIPTFS